MADFLTKPPLDQTLSSIVWQWCKQVFDQFYGMSFPEVITTTTTLNLGSKYAYPINTASGNCTCLLPLANKSIGKFYLISKTDSGSNHITITRQGTDTISGLTSLVVDQQYQSVEVYSDGQSTWYIKFNSVPTTPSAPTDAKYVMIGNDARFSQERALTAGSGVTIVDNGANNTVVISASGGGASPLTTKGDVWGFSTLDARIPIGTNGYVLTADSAQTLGLKWALPTTGINIWFGTTPPVSPVTYPLWWQTDMGALKVYYTDVDTSQWVDASRVKNGVDGVNGVGVPTGGTTGQVLAKIDATNYNTQWVTPYSSSQPYLCLGRLTLESGVPISQTDQTAKTNIFWTPYRGAQIALYDGTTTWTTLSFTETTLAVGTLTSGKNYDVFGYNNSGTLALEFSAAWTNDTTRTDAISLQDGIYVKTSAKTRRYLGTTRTTSTTTVEDSGGGSTSQVGGKRFLWNYYNRVYRQMEVIEGTTSWTYTTAAYRQANAATGNKVEYVTGVAEEVVSATLTDVILSLSNTNSNVIGIGFDSLLAPYKFTASAFESSGSSSAPAVTANLNAPAGIGYHFLAWLEFGRANTTFFGNNAGTFQCGMTARING